MSMVIWLKAILKRLFFLIVKLLPWSAFCTLRGLYARRKRGGRLLGHYGERVANYLNRRLLTEKLIAQGVPYFSDGEGRRYEIYSYVFDRYVHEPLDYLEFGVAQGRSMRWALSKLSYASHLYGFDSFEGLPSDWYRGVTRGTFGTGGKSPHSVL